MFFGNSCRRSNLTSPKIGRSGKGKKTLTSGVKPVNCNNTGTLTADKHAHTCLKPRWRFSRGSASKKLTFRGLGKVSRSGKFSQKLVFERKSARKSSFLSKVFNFKDSNLVSWIVLSILHPLTAKTSWVTA